MKNLWEDHFLFRCQVSPPPPSATDGSIRRTSQFPQWTPCDTYMESLMNHDF